jgi:ATPase subunit of ABC transporter with duplicated ATPase domains
LLDEPDKYLNISERRWFEQFIAESPKTLLLMSHDRHLLSVAASKSITMEATGTYSRWR